MPPVGSVHWEGSEALVSEPEISRAIDAALAHGGRPSAVVDVVFVDDPFLCDMHERFLGDPTPTDVISFDLGEEGPGPAGELYVSYECARRISQERGVTLARELTLYVVHGILHLCGLDDHDPEQRRAMREAEARVMGGLGFADDALPHEHE